MSTIKTKRSIISSKLFILSFLLLPNFLSAQDTLIVSKILELPETRNYYFLTSTVIFDELHFKRLFDEEYEGQIPAVDFKKFKLIGMGVCRECIEDITDIKIVIILDDIQSNYYIAGCDKVNKETCDRRQYWFLVEKGKYPEIEFTPFILPPRFDLPYFAPSVVDNQQLLDSIAPGILINQKIDFEKYLILTRTSGGDCHASYQHEVSMDTLQKALKWKVYNIYGGCRGAGFKDFVIQVPKPPEDYEIIYETELVD